MNKSEFDNLPEDAKPFFVVQDDGNVKPAFNPEQAEQSQQKLRQEAILAKQQAQNIENKLNEFRSFLPKDLQESPKDLGDFLIKAQAQTSNTSADEQLAIEEKLQARDKSYERELRSLKENNQREKEKLEKENQALKEVESERIAFRAFQIAARKHRLQPKYDEQLFQINRNRFSVNDNDKNLFITDTDGLASGTTVDQYFADKKKDFSEMFQGSAISGSGMVTQRHISSQTGNIPRNNLGILTNLEKIADGTLKVV